MNEDQTNLSARFPHDKHDFVRRALSQCRSLDILDDDQYDTESVEQNLSKIDAAFDHENFLKYVFPEENALLYTTVRNARPRRAACIGSYYGYWALTAKAACTDISITLLDIDATVMSLAEKTFQHLGLTHNATFALGNAEELVATLGPLDLLILDAEGPKSEDVPEDYRDKGIYYPHLKSALENLVPGALVVAHNVILGNFTQGVYFEGRQRYYREQYK